jgi:hypothetical protein
MRTMSSLLRRTAGYREALASILAGDGDPRVIASRALRLHESIPGLERGQSG